jgi:hypothetical protein
MNNINEKMNDAICNDDFNTIESIALNPKYAYVRCSQFNMFTGDVSWVKRWVDISSVGEEYFDDLNGDCQDYVMDLPQYKDMEYEKMVEEYDKPIEAKNNEALEWFKKEIEKNKNK